MSNDSSGVFVPSEAIVSNEVKQALENVIDFTLVSLTCYLGIIGNSVTIAAFRRQGYKETINISLTAIAIWDLIKCICGATYRLHGLVGVFSPALQLTYRAITSMAFAFTSYICGYVSNALAAYVSIERCLCVSLPFTVKYLLTPKVVTSVMFALSFITLGLFSITFSMHEINWVFHPSFNTTVAQKTLKQYFVYHRAAYKYYSLLCFVYPLTSVAIQALCTCIITYHLRKSAKFRSKNLSSKTDSKSDKDVMSSRDRQVTKMLLVIIILYIVNSMPSLASTLTKTFVPEFYMYRYYHNLFATTLYLLNTFDFFNAAVNPFVYYFMSSQYKATILEMFFNRKITQKSERKQNDSGAMS